jgi:hypothetical protein
VGQGGVVGGDGQWARDHGDGPAPEAGRLPVPPLPRRPVGDLVAGHEDGEPAVGQLGRDPGGAVTHGRQPDGQVGHGRLAEAERPCSRCAVERGALALQQGADLGRDLAQPVGRVGEADVVEALHQGAGAGAEPEDEAASREPVEGGGGHRQRARGAAPDRQDAGDEPDASGTRRGLGERQGRVQPPALGQGEGLVAEFVGELGRVQDDVVAGLHGREGHAAPSGLHPGPPPLAAPGGPPRRPGIRGSEPVSFTAALLLHIEPGLGAMLGRAGPAVRRGTTPADTSAGYLGLRGPRPTRRRSGPATARPGAGGSAPPGPRPSAPRSPGGRRSGGWSGRRRPGPRPGAGGP